MANLSKRINLFHPNEESFQNDSISSEFSDYLPKLIWILRDFTLDKGDISSR